MRKRMTTVFVAITATLGLALAGPVATASARPAAPSPLVGHYRLHYNWNHTGYTPEPMSLFRNHTGLAGLRSKNTVRWSTSGDTVTLVFGPDGFTATYVGTISATGFNARQAPGTMSNVGGAAGTWYAVRVDKP